MKRLLLLLFFTTSFVSAKYLYLGHFWGCSLKSSTTSFTIENNINQNLNYQSVFHSFHSDAVTSWQGENSLLSTMNCYTDRFGNLSIFFNCIFEDRDAWRNLEDYWIQRLNPARVSRKIVAIK